MKNPWSYKIRKRGKHGGETIIFCFQGREFAERVWYPPWRNEQERDNAKCIRDDLNKAFNERNS